jgi:hypothetical protein
VRAGTDERVTTRGCSHTHSLTWRVAASSRVFIRADRLRSILSRCSSVRPEKSIVAVHRHTGGTSPHTGPRIHDAPSHTSSLVGRRNDRINLWKRQMNNEIEQIPEFKKFAVAPYFSDSRSRILPKN